MAHSENARHSAGAARLDPGLYMVATPIGAARDITLRGLDILAGADVIAAEDTRTARKLMELHGVAAGGRPFVAYHDHNGAQARPRIMGALAAGQSVAYVSEAGTPMVADPGYQLVRAAISEGRAVFSAPGASAALAALVVSGLPSDRFLFAGFAPNKGEKRRNWLEKQLSVGATLVIYESPKRVHGLLGVLCDLMNEGGEMALCRELTKRHEEIIRGSVEEVLAAIDGRSLKGEIVLVIGPAAEQAPDEDDVETALRVAMRDGSVKTAATEVSAMFGLPRREVYQMALAIAADDDGTEKDE